MPTYHAFCKAPLVNPSYVPLSPTATHPEGYLADCVAELPAPRSEASRLLAALMSDGPAPECPDLSAPAEADTLGGTLELLHAALPVVALQKDKERMVQLLTRMREVGALLPALPEERVTPLGADCLRLCVELYRRTRQKLLLSLMAELRSQLPDFAGFFHSFPFVKPFVPGDAPEDATDSNAAYERRMALFATGRHTAEGLAITALLGQYSGSGREAAAAKSGLAALWRYHGLPLGCYSADPMLAGRDPAEGADVPALCALCEAYADLLCAQGDPHVADRMETLLFAGLRGALRACRRGEDPAQRHNQLRALPATDAPDYDLPLTRALYAVRRSVWLTAGDETLCLMLPLDSTCVTRMAGAPVRLRVRGGYPYTDEVRVEVECRKPARFTLQLRIPAFALGATVALEGQKPQDAPAGELFQLTRSFCDGDALILRLPNAPRMETGYRNALSVYAGNVLMALPVADDAPWRLALSRRTAWEAVGEAGQPRLRALATAVAQWEERNGRVAPPPQGTAEQADQPLELVPYADTDARISAFPQAGLA